MRTKISVIITTQNRNFFLKKAINSLMRQSFQYWEALIVDNNIDKKAYDVVCAFKDKRLRYLTLGRNLGECGGRNLGILNSCGEYICYLDDDDLLPDYSLFSRYDFAESCKTSGMIFGEYKKFINDNEIHLNSFNLESDFLHNMNKNKFDNLLKRSKYSPKIVYFYLKQFNFIRGGTPLIRRDVFQKVGMFDEKFSLFGDYDMWLRIASSTHINFINEVVYYYRQHEGSISFLPTEENLKLNAEFLINKHPKISNSLIKKFLI